MPNLLRQQLKLWLDTALVNISASCSWDWTWRTSIIFSSNFYLMKCLSTSTCLILSCWMGLWAISHAALLSQYNFIAFVCSISNSCIRFLIHNNSQIALVIPLYSALTDDLATTSCFLLRQVTKFPPTNVKYPDVDRRFSIDQPSQHRCTLQFLSFLLS